MWCSDRGSWVSGPDILTPTHGATHVCGPASTNYIKKKRPSAERDLPVRDKFLRDSEKELQNRVLLLATFGVGAVGTNRVPAVYFSVRQLGFALIAAVLCWEARGAVRSGHGFAYQIFEPGPA